MSKGNPIQIDGDEVEKVLRAISNGSVAKVRQGIINPSFFVNIVLDEDRTREFRRAVNDAIEHNRRDLSYNGGNHQKAIPTARPLKDIFEGVTLNLSQNQQNTLGDGQ